MNKVTRQCPQTTSLFFFFFLKKKESAEEVSNRGPSADHPNALPLGQIGSDGRKGRRGKG